MAITVVETLEEFRGVIGGEGKDLMLLLCTDGPATPVLTSVIERTMPCLQGKIGIVQFNCSACREAIQTSLGAANLPAVFAAREGRLLDSLQGEPCILADLESFARRFLAFCYPQTAATSDSSVVVNVTAMLAQGKDLVARGEMVYAERFFVKALSLLDVIAVEAPPSTEVAEATAVLLAWAAMARTLQSNISSARECVDRLRRQHEQRIIPESEVARAVALYDLLSAATFLYERGPAFNPIALRRHLAQCPTDWEARSKLAVALFLAGQLEECATEGIKLVSRGQEYGEVVMDALMLFLGPRHALLQASGWPDRRADASHGPPPP